MTQLFENTMHAGWAIHDAYWMGACIFIAHFIWLSPSVLQRRNILFSLVVMTAFWPLTYTFSIYQVIRMRIQKS
jgi:apolipoprotein N-acyltransferase